MFEAYEVAPEPTNCRTVARRHSAILGQERRNRSAMLRAPATLAIDRKNSQPPLAGASIYRTKIARSASSIRHTAIGLIRKRRTDGIRYGMVRACALNREEPS